MKLFLEHLGIPDELCSTPPLATPYALNEEIDILKGRCAITNCSP
jgi:hypothetical protein